LAQFLSLDRLRLYLNFDRALTREELERFKTLLKRRVKHEPVQYLLGRQEFWSLSFKITPEVLIPRPETEHLVEFVLDLIPREQRDFPFKILELGTGCGAVSIALAKELPQASILATDLSFAAVSLARENQEALMPGRKIRFLAGDFISFLGRGALFDFIVSNPPYIAASEWEALPFQVREFEPRGALNGGRDGLEAIARILPQGNLHLPSGGWLLLEIGEKQGPAVRALAQKTGGFSKMEIKKDFRGKDRIFMAQKG
jgi:release factor glutamine methyltransferase